MFTDAATVSGASAPRAPRAGPFRADGITHTIDWTSGWGRRRDGPPGARRRSDGLPADAGEACERVAFGFPASGSRTLIRASRAWGSVRLPPSRAAHRRGGTDRRRTPRRAG